MTCYDQGPLTIRALSGFVIEGRKRACVWLNNRWEDVLFMGILRDEWIERISILEQ
jgi:hypothetical protein